MTLTLTPTQWTRSPRDFLIIVFLLLFLLLPNLHIGVSSLAGRYRFDVTPDRPGDFRAPTASLILDHLKVV